MRHTARTLLSSSIDPPCERLISSCTSWLLLRTYVPKLSCEANTGHASQYGRSASIFSTNGLRSSYLSAIFLLRFAIGLFERFIGVRFSCFRLFTRRRLHHRFSLLIESNDHLPSSTSHRDLSIAVSSRSNSRMRFLWAMIARR